MALGSNRGDSVAIVRAAMRRLEGFAAGAVIRSSLWRTSPVDCPPGSANFVNAAAAFAPAAGLTPEALLAGLKRLEREFGRDAEPEHHAPRELDLDLLVFGDERRDAELLTLPHPRAMRRKFVLAPLAEVAPHFVWPGTGRMVTELLDALCSDERVERIEDTHRGSI